MNVEMPDGTIIEDVPDNYTKEQVQAMYDKGQPKQLSTVSPELSTSDKLIGGTRSFLEGQTFGFADEIGSGLAAIPASIKTGEPYGDVYSQMQDTYQKQQKEFERQMPGTALTANVAGGLLTGVPGAKALYGTKFAQINPVKTAIGSGAAMGGVGGAGYAPTMGDVPKYAGMGAAGGGVLAPFGYYAGKLAGKAGGALKNLVTPESPQKTISRTIGHYLGQDELTPQDLITASRAMGKDTTLADVGGENLRSLAMTASTKQGGEKTAAHSFYKERQKGSFKRVFDTLKKLSGGDSKYFQNQKAITERRFNEASPLYEAAKKESLTTNDMVDVFNKMQTISEDFSPSKGILKKFTRGKGEHKTFKTSIKELHSLQREIRDLSTAAYKAGKNELGGAYGKMQKELINTLSEKNASYGQARKIWADESALNDAIKSGRNILKDDFDEVADNIANLSISEQEAYINGAVKTITDKLKVGREGLNSATKLAGQGVREKLRNAFPDDESFNKFIGQLDIEDQYASTFQKLYGGSQTQPRGLAEKEFSQIVGGRSAIEGSDTVTVVGNAIKKTLDIGDVPQVVIDDITKILSTPVHKIPKKQIDSLLKHGISKADLNKIKGDVSGALSMQGISQTQRELSR